MVCQKSKVQDWIEHFDLYDYTVYDLTKKADFAAFLQNHSGIGIINYDLLFRRKELLDLENFTLLLDESQNIQNEHSKRGRFVLKMNPAAVILLSGTPVSGKYEKLWSQLRLLGWNISKTAFYNSYIETRWLEGFHYVKIVCGYKNVEHLKRKLSEYGAVFMKTEEAIELPEQVYQQIKVPTTLEYRKFMRNALVNIGDQEFVGDTSLKKRLYARMLCGAYNEKKLLAVKDLLASSDERFIVFYNFDHELEMLREVVGKLEKPLSIVNGHERNLTAYETDPSSVTLVQYQAGATGLNLQQARRIIYFTPPERSDLFEQSKKRIHRVGQDKTCFYYTCVCDKSVEEKIYENLEMRRDYTDELFKKDY